MCGKVFVGVCCQVLHMHHKVTTGTGTKRNCARVLACAQVSSSRRRLDDLVLIAHEISGRPAGARGASSPGASPRR